MKRCPELKKYIMDMLTLRGTILEFITHNMNGHMEHASAGGRGGCTIGVLWKGRGHTILIVTWY